MIHHTDHIQNDVHSHYTVVVPTHHNTAKLLHNYIKQYINAISRTDIKE